MHVPAPHASLETPPCPLCGSVERRPLALPFDPYGVARCTDCGLSYLAPRLSEQAMLDQYRQDDYFEGGEAGYESYAQQETALRMTFRRFLAALATRGRCGGRLLEVGCGFGLLLDEARPHFTTRVGTDYSLGAVRAARTRADRVHHGGLEDLREDNRFDCIIATQVVEHVYAPHAFVAALRAHAAPGATIVLATPDAGSFWRRWMGRRWPSYKLPEHVLYFDASTLGRLMREGGLHSLDEIPYPHAFPVSLILSKLGLGAPRFLAQRALWLPKTTLALCGTAP